MHEKALHESVPVPCLSPHMVIWSLGLPCLPPNILLKFETAIPYTSGKMDVHYCGASYLTWMSLDL